MSEVRIKDIYAGMPDAKDEFYTGQEENFYATYMMINGHDSQQKRFWA